MFICTSLKHTLGNGQKPVLTDTILVSEQIALATIFYFEQVFAFCTLINKSMLECFLLIICKEHTLARFTNLFRRNHPTLCFWLIRKGRQMPNTEQLLYQTDKSSNRRSTIKKAVLVNFTIFLGKHLCCSLFFSLIKKDFNKGILSLGKPIDSYWFKMSCLSFLVFICVHCFFLKMMKLYKDICSAWIRRTSAEMFFSYIDVINVSKIQ